MAGGVTSSRLLPAPRQPHCCPRQTELISCHYAGFYKYQKFFNLYVKTFSLFSWALPRLPVFSDIINHRLRVRVRQGSGCPVATVAGSSAGFGSPEQQPPATSWHSRSHFCPWLGTSPHLTTSSHPHTSTLRTWGPWSRLTHPSPSLGLASWYKRDLCPCCWLSWERVTVQSSGQIRSHPLHLLPRQSCSYRVTALSAHSTQVHYHCSGGSLVFGSSSLLSEALFVTTYSPLLRPHCVML